MAEDLVLPLPVSSDISSLCHNRRVNNDDDQHLLGNNSSQRPSLTLSPPLPAIREGPVNGSEETRFPEGQSLSRSPKKPKRPENLTSVLHEIATNVGGESFLGIEGFRGSCEESCVSDEAAAETSGDNHEFVQASDELLNFDGRNDFAGFELGRKRHGFDCVELKDGVCGVEREDFSNCSREQCVELDLEKQNRNFEGKGSIIGQVLEPRDRIGYRGHGSENQSVVDEDREANLLNLEYNCELESESGKYLNVDALACSLNAQLVDQGVIVDASMIVDKGSKRRGRTGDSNLIANGVGRKVVYSRKDMEALRFMNVKAQKKFWQEIHNGLENNVKKEYDELGNSKHQKHVNRRKNAEMRDCNAQGLVGESSLEDVICDTEIISSVDLTCGVSNNEDSNDLVEEWSEQEESDDEYESIQRPAFLVEGEPDFESGPPEDGLEYLRRVRWEAAHIPKVKVAKIDNAKLKKEQSVYMPKIPDIEKCPPHLAPSKQWEDEFVTDFSELRLVLSRLDDTSDTTADPRTIIFGPSEHKSHSSKSRASLELPEGGPTLSIVLAMDLATRVAMLKRRISLLENARNLSKDDCAWLFALCAAVDTPLDADTCASLRCLLRRCAKLRAGKSELDDEVVMLNVLATISGKFFGQLED